MIPPSVPPFPDDSPIRRVGPYRLYFELASGGMGTVYLARGGNHHPFVAVKVIHPHLANERGFVQMFLDEAEISARISHPNVCRVLDFGEGPTGPYLVMEHLVGEPLTALARRLRRRPIDPKRLTPRIAATLAGACRGLHAAHELTDEEGEPLHVVHRDVAPGNLFLTLDGVTKVLDFGVAAGERKRHRTKTGVLKGRLAYAAPEVLAGAKPDRRADVWGIGVVAWELLTGLRLFRRDTDLDTLKSIQSLDVEPPSKLRPGLPPEVDAVVMRALARDPDDRYATARDLGRDLNALASAEEVVTTSELADWMEELFPGARERAEQLCRVATQLRESTSGPTTPVARVSSAPPPVPSFSPVSAELSRTLLRRPAASEPPPPPPPPRADRRWTVAVGVLGTCLGFGAAYLLGPVRGAAEPPPVESAHGPATRPIARPLPPPTTEWETEAGPTAMRVVSGDLSVRIVEQDGQLVLRVAPRDLEDQAPEAEPTLAQP